MKWELMVNHRTSKIPVIGFASGIAANNVDCGLGPEFLKKSQLLTQNGLNLAWQKIIKAPPKSPTQLQALPIVAELNTQLAELTKELVLKQQRFLVLGGDHSSAIGTWSGTAAAIKENGPLGLIWIDAHMDSHTLENTESGNIHGMPLACLLGYGPAALTHIQKYAPKILPQHLCLIGIRSFETAEAELLQRLKVKIFLMDEIRKKGLASILKEALKVVTSGTAGYGMSIDLDAIDPNDAPGVGKPEKNGLNGPELCRELKIVREDPKLSGVEIVEFNPNLDRNHKTELLVKSIIESAFPA